MQDGIYVAQFVVGGNHGHGVAVKHGDRVTGGDSWYWWEGDVTEATDGTLSVSLMVRVHTSGNQSVFGFFTEFPLNVSGRAKGDAYQFTGASSVAPGRPMELNLRLLQAS